MVGGGGGPVCHWQPRHPDTLAQEAHWPAPVASLCQQATGGEAPHCSAQQVEAGDCQLELHRCSLAGDPEGVELRGS